MTSGTSLIFIIIIGAGIGVYYLYKQGKIPWLKGLKLPKMFEPKADTQIERLKSQTEKETERTKELQSVLDAKTELAKARAENTRLQKRIDDVNEKSVEKERRREQEAKNEKPKRL